MDRRFCDFLPEQRQQVQQRSTRTVGAPFRKSRTRRTAAWTKTAQASQKEQGIRSYCQRRLTRNGARRPDLRMSNAKDGFLISVVDFDLPSVKVALDQLPDWTADIGGQQIAWLPVIDGSIPRHLIGKGGNDNQPQFSSACSTPPEDRFDEFVTDAPSSLTQPDFTPEIPSPRRCKDILRREGLKCIMATAPFGRWKAQTCVLTAPGQQGNTIQRTLVKGTVAETRIADHPQNAISCIQLIELVTILSDPVHRFSRQIGGPAQTTILFPLLVAGSHAGLLQNGGLF